MCQNVIAGSAQPSTVLSPRAEELVFRAVDYIFEADDPKSRIESALGELKPQALGDLYPVIELALESLGQFFLGVESLLSTNVPEACEYFESAARGFDQTGVIELRDLAAGFALYTAAIVELQEFNIGRSTELFAQVRTYLQQAGRYGRHYQQMIDHIQPENLFVQGVQALTQSDFSTARTLIEQASQAAEKVAHDYYAAGTPDHHVFLGLAHIYMAQYTVARAFNDFSRFEYDSLAAETDLTADAIQARELLSEASREYPHVVIATYLSRGHSELLDLIGQLARIMQAVLNSTFQPDPRVYEALQQQIRRAEDSYARAGPQATLLVNFCDQLSNQVNNLERLARPRSVEVQPVVLSLQEKVALSSYENFQKATLQSLQAPLKQLGWWSTLTLTFVGLSVMLILAGAASALFLTTQASVLTSISSILTTLISSVLYLQLRQARKEVKDSRGSILEQFEDAGQRLFENAPSPVAPGAN